MTAASLGIIYLFPYLNKTIPSPLVCIVVLTGISMWLHLDVRTVGDMGKLPDSLPVFLLPDVPLNFDTLSIILPYSAGLAVVGLLESMMTATIVDDMTDTPSDKTGSVRLRVANIGAAFIGGMAGCAMIGQSVINVKSGGVGVSPHSPQASSCFVWWSSCVTGFRRSQWRPGSGDDHGFYWHLLTALYYQLAQPPTVNQRRHAGYRSRGGSNA